MTLLIIIFAALVFLGGIVIAINPELVFAPLSARLTSPALQVTAVMVRLAIGALLITQAGLSKYPAVIEILGWASIVAALTLALIGRGRFQRLMSWALSLAQRFGRIAGIFAAAFGAFLIYSFL